MTLIFLASRVLRTERQVIVVDVTVGVIPHVTTMTTMTTILPTGFLRTGLSPTKFEHFFADMFFDEPVLCIYVRVWHFVKRTRKSSQILAVIGKYARAHLYLQISANVRLAISFPGGLFFRVVLPLEFPIHSSSC